MKIAIISYAENNSATKSIRKSIENKGHDAIVLNPNNLAMLINNRKGYDMLYTKSNKTEIERVYANDIDAIIPRIGTNILYSTTIIDHLNLNLGIFSLQSGQGLRIASNKLLTLQMCSRQGIPTPKTIYANDPTMIDHYIDMVGGAPIVVKTLNGSKGEGVLLLDSNISAKSTLQALFRQNTSILIQEFIKDAKGSDLRAIILGENVICAYKRQAQKGDFRANINKGATAIPVTLTQEEQDLCVKCVKSLNLVTAAVDFFRSPNGFVLCEINGNYGLFIQQITNVNIGDKLVNFIECEQSFQKQKQKQIDFPSRKDLMHRFQEDEIEKMIKDIQKQKQTIDSILKNPKFLSYFKMAKNKEVEYLDSNNINKVIKVESPQDLYNLMVDTFQLIN
jgi:ribosomal protein S6--L-glutamate ligase